MPFGPVSLSRLLGQIPLWVAVVVYFFVNVPPLPVVLDDQTLTAFWTLKLFGLVGGVVLGLILKERVAQLSVILLIVIGSLVAGGVLLMIYLSVVADIENRYVTTLALFFATNVFVGLVFAHAGPLIGATRDALRGETQP